MGLRGWEEKACWLIGNIGQYRWHAGIIVHPYSRVLLQSTLSACCSSHLIPSKLCRLGVCLSDQQYRRWIHFVEMECMPCCRQSSRGWCEAFCIASAHCKTILKDWLYRSHSRQTSYPYYICSSAPWLAGWLNDWLVGWLAVISCRSAVLS